MIVLFLTNHHHRATVPFWASNVTEG